MSEVAVKAFIRVRPLLGKELLQSDDECIQIVSADQLVLGRDRLFRFDQVFQQNSTQSTVYNHCVHPLVSSCLAGYNVTVLAYGQTGSGKSFTMGSEDTLGALTSEGKGIIPRALGELFECIQGKKAEFQYAVCVSYIEIYKEELRDLLGDGGVTGEGRQEMHIREDDHGNTVVIGCSEQLVESEEEALGWLGVGNAARITGVTQMNQHSSRSHAVFTLHIRQRRRVMSAQLDNEDDAPSIDGMMAEGDGVSSKFHFVDLAGSERAGRTGNRGERFKESVHINSGLLALGNVISALGNPRRRGSHIPYRDSKITRLLKDSLGGNARTIMVTCLSPAAANFAENLNSLKYAKRARMIQNRPVVNRDPQSNKIQHMKEEIALLREELLRAKMETRLLSSKSLTTVGSDEVLNPGSDDVLNPGSGDDIIRMQGSDVMATRCSSVVKPGSDNGVVLRMREIEEELARTQRKLQSYSVCVKEVREKMVELVEERRGSEGVEASKNEGEVLQECLNLIKSCDKVTDGVGVVALPQDGLFSSKNSETISLLRSELEQCRQDLHSNEQIVTEKIEEVLELRSTCEELLREKERAEAMWGAAQESEVELQMQLEQLLAKVAALERERDGKVGVMNGGEEVGVMNGGGEVGVVNGGREVGVMNGGGEVGVVNGGREVGVVNGGGEVGVVESEVKEMNPDLSGSRGPDISTDSLSGGVACLEEVASSSLKQPFSDEEKFKATRSLFQGKVKTTSLEDFTEEALVASLRTLTHCLIEGQVVPPKSRSMGLKDTHTIHPPPVVEQTADLALLDTVGVVQTGSERPITPLESSEREPRLSLSSRGHCKMEWNENNQEGSEVKMGNGKEVGGITSRHKSEMELLNESALDSRQQLDFADEKLSRAHEELRCLTIKIKLKEELIHELGKNSRTAKKQNQIYLKKIQGLEEEAVLVQEELGRVQMLVQKQQERQSQGQDSRKIITEHKKKLAFTEKKLAALQKKQKDTVRLATYGARSEHRIEELESGIERLRNQQESLRRKLKQQAEKKIRLENDLQKYQHRMKNLQTRSEQQSKVLRVKTEEAAAAQRKLRLLSGSSRPTTCSNLTKSQIGSELVAQKEWLEEELERIMGEKQAIAALERDLMERERIIHEKEALVLARDSLELKKLKCGQVVARDLERVSVQVNSIDSYLKEHTAVREEKQLKGTDKDHHKKLIHEKEKLVREYETLQEKMTKGNLLSSKDQQILLILNEQIQVLEAAIDFKNDSISSRRVNINNILADSLERSHTPSLHDHTSFSLGEKLKGLRHSEVCDLLEHYFHKVVELRTAEGEGRHVQKELEVKVEEEREGRRRVEAALGQVQLEGERKLVAQQVEHSKQVELLMQQVSQSQDATSGGAESADLTGKVKSLEKDLYYYKKTSRDLRKKLQAVSLSSTSGVHVVESIKVSSEERVNSAPELEENAKRERRKRKKKKDGGVPIINIKAGEMGGTLSLGDVRDIEDEDHIVKASSETGLSGVTTRDKSGLSPSKVLVSAERGEARGGTSSDHKKHTVKKQKKDLRQLSASDLVERQKRTVLAKH